MAKAKKGFVVVREDDSEDDIATQVNIPFLHTP